MMSELLHVISASDKRRNLLILLNSGPLEWDAIKQNLNVTSTGMLPQIKILEEEHLVGREGRRFFLTPLGKVLATRMEPLVRTMEVLEKNKKFWREHDLGVLPQEILLDISDLGNYQIAEVPDEDFFNVNPFLENIAQAKTIKGIAHTVHPKYPLFFLALAKKGVESSLILTPGVYRVIKEKYRDLLEEWLACRNAHLYVPDKDIKFSFVVTDLNFSISLFFNSGVFDAKKDVVSYDLSARRWGDRIFAYYQNQSKKIEFLD
jgi:predicted transcriptional regulator